MRPLLLVFLVACEPAELVVGGGDDDETPADTEDPSTDTEDPPADTEDPPADTEDPPADTEEPPADTEDPPEEPDLFQGAVLVVDAPVPGFIYDDGTRELELDAHLEAPDGSMLDFEAIHWSLRENGNEIYVGTADRVKVPWGMWTVDVTAELPSGAVLRSAIGAVRVQSPRTGIYVGSTEIAATLGGLGVPINTSCVGSLSFEVDLSGRRLAGDGACGLAFVGAQLNFDLIYDLNGDISDPGASGDLMVDAGIIPLPMPWGGTFRAGNTLDGTFDGFGLSLFGYSFDLSGTFTATRVSRYLE